MHLEEMDNMCASLVL